MSDLWHAQTYSQFLDARTKPAQDLLFSIPRSFSPKTIYDLGCGPGNSTILLHERWPTAHIVGLDSSADMLQSAQKNYPKLQFMQGDLSTFIPAKPLDCIFSNAALQWTKDHHTLIPRLLGFLNPGGILAIQMPNNFHSPSHQVTIELLHTHAEWRPLLDHIAKTLGYGRLTAPFYHAADYYNILADAKAHSIQIWETEYVQEMPDHQAIFNWVQGTGLRPVLTQMTQPEQKRFEAAYVQAVSQHYPLQHNGKVLLPFRRLFMVAMAKSI